MDTFSPPTPPDYSGNGVTESPRLISVNFGDGYALSAPDGLNPNDATATFSWTGISEDDKTTLMNFYYSHIGQVFKWNAPGDIAPNSGKWLITSAKTTVASFNTHTVQFELKIKF